MKLYHCSPTPGLTVLRPSVSKYFGKPKQVCLTSSLPMALLYGIKHYEYTYGYTKDGEIYYEEYFPCALEELYRGKGAFLYTCALRAGMEPTAIPNEYVTRSEVPVESEQVIPDVLEALLEQERLGALRIVRWPDLSEAARRWVEQAEADVIREQGLLSCPETPFSSYMREKYPESWALAIRKEQGGQ